MKPAFIESPAFEVRSGGVLLANWLKGYPSSIFNEQLYQSIELMERYSIELALDLLRRLDVIGQLADWQTASELCRSLAFQPAFGAVLGWLLERLVETGCIEVRTEGEIRAYRLRNDPWLPDLEPLRAVGLEINPGNAATLDLLDHAARLYPGVARGELNGDHGLLGPGGIGLWLNYFHNDNLTYSVNNWVAALLVAECVATQSRLRILEIGAGAGSATEILLRCFDERGLRSRIERYIVTEPNAFFRRRAQRELPKRYPDVAFEWGALDLNLPWTTQGIAPGEFDLILAVNVFHVSNDLLSSLQQARLALAAGGCLVIGECLRPYRRQPMYPEMIFQILGRFTDVQTDPEFRPNPGFLTAEQWRRAFSRAGFDRVQVAPEVERIHEFYPHFFTGAVCGQNAGSAK